MLYRVTLILVVICLMSCKIMKDQNICQVVENHLEKYPKMQAQDIYKLLYQATMGPAHFINDKNKSYEYLLKEAKHMKGSLIEEEMIEYISPVNNIYRMNLRGFLKKGGDLKLLNEEFYRSSKEFIKSKEKLLNYIQKIEKAIKDKKLLVDFDQWRELVGRLKKENYPPVHHSDIYRQHYRPAYRLIINYTQLL